jgi:lipoprotein-anchoring transpeptidase ErfK/SrfK
MSREELRRITARGAIVAALSALALPSAGHAAAPPPPTAMGAALTRPIMARAHATTHSRKIERIDSTTPFTWTRMVLPVISTTTDARGRQWLRVRLPYRGRHTTGWLPAAHVKLTTLTFHLVVSRRMRQLTVWHLGHVLARYRVVVGKPSTPTPAGEFFILDRERLYNSWAHGQWALSTSAYSRVLQHFEGGIGEVALHAKASLGDRLGSAASHGCVRLSDSVASHLARIIPNGTPLTVLP